MFDGTNPLQGIGISDEDTHTSSSTTTSTDALLTSLREELARLARRPPPSSYRLHRERVCTRALQLAEEQANTGISADAANELASLLDSLSL